MRNTRHNHFQVNSGQTDKYIRMSCQGAEKNFVNYFYRPQSENGEIIPATSIQKLDSGEYDTDLVAGLRLVAALWHGVYAGGFILSDEQNLVLWRWVVAAVFVCEMFDTNGSVEVKNEQGEPEEVAVYTGEHGGIVICPWSERFALANHIEGLAYEMFPADSAPKMASAIYRSMIDVSSVTGIDMSERGLKGMALLHDGFIETLKTEGIPAEQVVY